MSYNLIDEPWIRVRALDGAVEEWSLRRVLADASKLRGLAGELPTQDAAILRLLLSIPLGATRPDDLRSDDESLDLWADWWDRGSLPMDVIDPYLDAVRPRFDLLDPDAPFFQVADLTTARGQRSGLWKLIADVPAGHPFFTTRAGVQLETLSLGEAARWVVNCQAFDHSGNKSGAVGDARVKDGKGGTFGYPAWAGNLGLVIAEGRNLFETILFNTPWAMSGPTDLPVWERPPLGPGVETPEHVPQGPADLFTWQSRRLRLYTEGGRVVDVLIANGDKLTPQNRFAQEAMSAWRYSKEQSKGGGRVYMPVLHDPGRRIWQGLGALLPSRVENRPAPVIEWLAKLKNEGLMAPDRLVDLRIVGLGYGKQNSFVVGAIDDRMTAAVAALTDPILVEAAVDAADRASRGVVALANLAGNLDEAAGRDSGARKADDRGGGAREGALEVGYSLLDAPYRAWLRRLVDPERVAEQQTDWDAQAAALLKRAGEDLLRDAGPAAIVGRPVKQRGKAPLDAGQAGIRFRSALAKAFPFLQPVREETR